MWLGCVLVTGFCWRIHVVIQFDGFIGVPALVLFLPGTEFHAGVVFSGADMARS